MPIRGSPNGAAHSCPRSPQPRQAGGRHPSEWVDAINRYGWTSSIGIGGRHHSVRPCYLRGKLRNRRFFSLEELNGAIRECITIINARAMKRLNKSRNELFATIDQPALKPLPAERYPYADWKRCTVAPDYHVEVEKHYYSVPFRLLREVIEARFTDKTVELLHKGV